MKLAFIDDARQDNPSRTGMEPLIAAGAVIVDGDNCRTLERSLEELCCVAGFPQRQEFKWSPGKELWMRKNLIKEKRESFFCDILQKLAEHKAVVMVCISDTKASSATGATSRELDVTTLLLERLDRVFGRETGIVIADRPSGDRRDEDQFLLDCLETFQNGTDFSKFGNIALNILTSNSRYVRLLQAADLITSCVTSHVSGENTYSPPVFRKIALMIREDSGRKGGVGLKIHPDFKYANLYHWILEDTHFWRCNCGHPMPLQDYPYSENDGIPKRP